jgi:Uri superfamily endonuclease
MTFPELPRHKGSYLLLLEMSQRQTLTVGALGRFDFSPGLYAYAGSARGPGGLAARLRHHLKKCRRCHWHIDYLRLKAPVVAIWAGRETATYCLSECQLAGRLDQRLPFVRPFKGFGSSDCTCNSHLLHWQLPAFDAPPLSTFRKRAIQRIDIALAPLTRLSPPT